jgi:hypothetical protein
MAVVISCLLTAVNRDSVSCEGNVQQVEFLFGIKLSQHLLTYDQYNPV